MIYEQETGQFKLKSKIYFISAYPVKSPKSRGCKFIYETTNADIFMAREKNLRGTMEDYKALQKSTGFSRTSCFFPMIVIVCIIT